MHFFLSAQGEAENGLTGRQRTGGICFSHSRRAGDRAHARRNAMYFFHTRRGTCKPSAMLSTCSSMYVYLEGHLEGIVHQEPPGEHVALAQQDLDHLRRLPRQRTHTKTSRHQNKRPRQTDLDRGKKLYRQLFTHVQRATFCAPQAASRFGRQGWGGGAATLEATKVRNKRV